MKNKILWTITGLATVVAVATAWKPFKTPADLTVFLVALTWIVLFLALNFRAVIRDLSRV